jgi:hypothetical protein
LELTCLVGKGLSNIGLIADSLTNSWNLRFSWTCTSSLMDHKIPSYLFFRWYKFYFIHVLNSFRLYCFFNQFIKLLWYFLFFLIFWLNNNNMPFSWHSETIGWGFNQLYGIDNSVWVLSVWMHMFALTNKLFPCYNL